jgi:hypothetical protein
MNMLVDRIGQFQPGPSETIMNTVNTSIRRARPEEASKVADLWILVRRASVPQIPPPVHSDAEVRHWFEDIVFPNQDVWVVDSSDDLIALMVLDKDRIEQFYVHPLHHGGGV